MPYENASSVYFGNSFRVAAFGWSGTTSPLAASWPVQSWAPTITSGASAAATVPRLSRMSPKFLITILTSAPRAFAHAVATSVTAVLRSWSVQITTVGPAVRWADAAVTDASATRTTRLRIHPILRFIDSASC